MARRIVPGVDSNRHTSSLVSTHTASAHRPLPALQSRDSCPTDCRGSPERTHQTPGKRVVTCLKDVRGVPRGGLLAPGNPFPARSACWLRCDSGLARGSPESAGRPAWPPFVLGAGRGDRRRGDCGLDRPFLDTGQVVRFARRGPCGAGRRARGSCRPGRLGGRYSRPGRCRFGGAAGRIGHLGHVLAATGQCRPGTRAA
jgi:hypothetical protein